MFGVPIWAIKWGAVALAVPLIVGGIWLHGRSVGKDAVLDRLKDDRIQILKDGKEIDRDVDLSDDDGLCGLLGGCGVRDGAGGN